MYTHATLFDLCVPAVTPRRSSLNKRYCMQKRDSAAKCCCALLTSSSSAISLDSSTLSSPPLPALATAGSSIWTISSSSSARATSSRTSTWIARRSESGCESDCASPSESDFCCSWTTIDCAISCLGAGLGFSFVGHDSGCGCDCDSCSARAASSPDCAISSLPSAGQVDLSSLAVAARQIRRGEILRGKGDHRSRAEEEDRGSREEERDADVGRESDDDGSCDCASVSVNGSENGACSWRLQRS
jgi:hypothetical protein